MSLAEKIRSLRERNGLTLDELAARAGISKTYLWELEKDTAGAKKPSADVLLRLAKGLSTTIAELLSLPSVRTDSKEVELPPSLVEFNERMKAQGLELNESELQDLARMQFRGGQPQTADDWMQVYLVFARTTRKKKP